MKRFMRGLLVATLATGLLATAAPASAAPTAPAAPATVSASVSSAPAAKPPVIKKVRVACHDEGAIVVLRLRNRDQTEQSFLVSLSGAEAQSQAVTLAPKTTERLAFDGVPNGDYQVLVENADGVVVAQTQVRVNC